MPEIVDEECTEIEMPPQSESELPEFFAVPGLRTLPSAAPTGGSVMYGTLSRAPGGQFETMESWEPMYFRGAPIQNPGTRIRSINPEPINDMPTSSSPLIPGFTDEMIRAWADGRMCSITVGSERHVIEALARIIVREVLR